MSTNPTALVCDKTETLWLLSIVGERGEVAGSLVDAGGGITFWSVLDPPLLFITF